MLYFIILGTIVVIMGVVYFFYRRSLKRLPTDGENVSYDIQDLDQTTSDDYIKGIESIYSFLSKDYENRGYNDALVNPDDSYKTANINIIKNDLQTLIKKVITGYENKIHDIDVYSALLKRQGLMDRVELMQNTKEKICSHIEEIKREKNYLENNKFDGVIFFSYQKGFLRGLSMLAQSGVYTPLQLDILNKKS